VLQGAKSRELLEENVNNEKMNISKILMLAAAVCLLIAFLMFPSEKVEQKDLVDLEPLEDVTVKEDECKIVAVAASNKEEEYADALTV